VFLGKHWGFSDEARVGEVGGKDLEQLGLLWFLRLQQPAEKGLESLSHDLQVVKDRVQGLRGRREPPGLRPLGIRRSGGRTGVSDPGSGLVRPVGSRHVDAPCLVPAGYAQQPRIAADFTILHQLASDV
jgi:hypothetical protein